MGNDLTPLAIGGLGVVLTAVALVLLGLIAVR